MLSMVGKGLVVKHVMQYINIQHQTRKSSKTTTMLQQRQRFIVHDVLRRQQSMRMTNVSIITYWQF